MSKDDDLVSIPSAASAPCDPAPSSIIPPSRSSPADAPPAYDTPDLSEVYARCPPPSSLRESYTSPYAVPEGLTREEHLARRFPHGLPLGQPPPSPMVRRGEQYDSGYRAGEVEKGFLRLIDEEHMTHSRDGDMVSHKSRLARWHKGDDPPLPPPLSLGRPTTGGLVIRPGMPVGLFPRCTEHLEPQMLKIHCKGLFATPVQALDLEGNKVQFLWSVSRKMFDDSRNVFDKDGKPLFSVLGVARGPYTRQWLFYPPGAFQRRKNTKSEPVLTVSLMDTDPLGEETMVIKFVSAITLACTEQPGYPEEEKGEKDLSKFGQMELVLRCNKVSRIWSLCTPENMILAEVVPKSLNHINWMVWVAPRMDTVIGVIAAFVVTRRRNEQKMVDPGVAAAG